MPFSTVQYIEGLDFDYFETYSFQRLGLYEEYNNILTKKRNDISLSSDEKERFKELTLSVNQLGKLIDYKKEFHHSSEKISRISRDNPFFGKILDVFRIELEEDCVFMCPPIYRDGMVFYNTQNEIVSVLNICFECRELVSNLNAKVAADSKFYTQLKNLLRELGHPIEDRY